MVRRVDLHVGRRIRRRRLILGLTQEQLAARIGTRYQQVQKYETGNVRVSAGCLWDIAQALGVSVPYFFKRVGEPVESARDMPGDVFRRVETRALIQHFSALPPRGRRLMLDLAHSLRGASASVQ